MLKTMRAAAGGVLAKALLGLLILSFGVWGIGDMLRAHGAGSALATVGGREIPRQAFMRAYNAAEDRARMVLGTRYSPELLRMLGISHQVLEQLITEELLRRETEAMGLNPPDTAIAREIRADPTFHDAKGNFSRSLFESDLRRAGLAEGTYVAELKQQKAEELLLGTIGLKAPVDDTMLSGLWQAAREERTARIIILKPGQANIKTPDDAALQAYYRAHMQDFVTPEYRTLRYATITGDALTAGLTPSEDDLKEAYKERSAAFAGAKVAPYAEVRPDLVREWKEQHADEALSQFSAKLDDLLAGGATLNEAAKELRMQTAEVGPVSRGGKAPDGAKVALPPFEGFLDAAFSLDENSNTPPREGKNGMYYVIQVERITPSKPEPFAAVKAQASEAWKKEQREKETKASADKLSAALSGAADPKKEIGSRGLQTVSSGKITRNDSKTPSGMPLPAGLVRELFSLPVGRATQAYPAPDGNYMIAVSTGRFPVPRPDAETFSKDKAAAREKTRLEDLTRQELLESYLQYLRGKYPVTVNEAALAAITDDNSGQ